MPIGSVSGLNVVPEYPPVGGLSGDEPASVTCREWQTQNVRQRLHAVDLVFGQPIC